MKKTKFAAVAVSGFIAIAVVSIIGCSATDVVAKYANTSFSALVAASGDRVSWSAGDYAWRLASPEGDRFSLSTDFARNGSPDAELSFDASPFVAAGLDGSRLAPADGVAYSLADGRLAIGFELGGEDPAPGAADSIGATFAGLVKTQRARIGYHEALDHYGIKLGDGNMIEWAKDLSSNDKDLVFVLNPAPLIAAGVDPAKVVGWAFAKVEMKDGAGKTISVDKLLRPYDLR